MCDNLRVGLLIQTSSMSGSAEISRVDVSIPDIENLMSKVTMAETESQRIA